MQAFQSIQTSPLINTIVHGDCIEVMCQMHSESIDFIVTDPPYLVNYRDRTGRSIRNDADASWLKPAMKEAHRVLKQNRLMLCFYGWNRIDKFFDAWKNVGFQPVGHIVFRKSYSRQSRFLHHAVRHPLRVAAPQLRGKADVFSRWLSHSRIERRRSAFYLFR